MTALHVAVRGGRFVCYRTDNGITRQYIGCDHGTDVRAAVRHNENTDPYTSPLRAAGLASHPSPVVPPSGQDAEATPAPRNRVSGSGSTRVPAPPPVSVELLPEPWERGSLPDPPQP